MADGSNNLTTLSYDGYDRLTKTEFSMPTTGSGASNPSDYEARLDVSEAMILMAMGGNLLRRTIHP